MKCLDCSQEVVYCNSCVPKPQRKNKVSLTADLIGGFKGFRIARHEAVFIRAADLHSVSDYILGTLRMSNVVVTERNNEYSLEKIMEQLAAKVLGNEKWKQSAQARFIVISPEHFKQVETFLQGGQINNQNSRGSMLTAICSKIEIAQKRINNPDESLSFVTKFLGEKETSYADFLGHNVPTILKAEIGIDFLEEAKEREREEKKMSEQLKSLNAPVAQDRSNELIGVGERSQVNAGNEKTPDFMAKFTADSNKLIQEAGKEFF